MKTIIPDLGVIPKADSGYVTELRCTYDPETRGGDSPDGRKVKATLHWVSARHAFPAEVRLYDRLFTEPEPESDKEGCPFTDFLNPDSLTVLTEAKLEPGLKDAKPGERYQFERLGYFTPDSVDSEPGKPIFNRTATLRDTWAKARQK